MIDYTSPDPKKCSGMAIAQEYFRFLIILMVGRRQLLFRVLLNNSYAWNEIRSAQSVVIRARIITFMCLSMFDKGICGSE